jgi:hypothetical protein
MLKDTTQLKALFGSGNSPSQTSWNHLFDWLLHVEGLVEQAATDGPVIFVDDADHMYAIGPSLMPGATVRQVDSGLTYVKQQEPGDTSGDWELMGDVLLTIPDIIGLEAALDTLLLRTGDDVTVGTISAHNFGQHPPVSTLIPVTQDLQQVITLNRTDGIPFNRAVVMGNFTLSITGGASDHGFSQMVMVRNASEALVSFTKPADTETEKFIVINTTSTVEVAAGKTMTISVNRVALPEGDSRLETDGTSLYLLTCGKQFDVPS